jgi:hypothetical protein
MPRPSLLAILVAAAVLPALALAGPVSTSVPVPGTFDRVESRGSFDVQVREGSPASVEIVAEPGEAERFQIEVDGGLLRLSRDDEKKTWGSSRDALVKVVLPEFRGFSVRGSGKGTAESGPAPRDVKLGVSGSGSLSWKGVASSLDAAASGSGDLRAEGSSSKLSVAVSGSGDASVAGDTGSARVAISGSGDVKLAGKGEQLEVSIAGSGGVHAKDFPVKDASVSIAGSGDVDLRLAGGTVSARIAGSGNVNWWGEGKTGSVNTAGSGRVRQR